MALIIELKVVPQSGRHALVIDKSGKIKCFLTAAPVDGKANRELIELIAEFVGVAKNSVEIIQGLTGKNKKLAIVTSMTFEQFLDKIHGGVQKKIF